MRCSDDQVAWNEFVALYGPKIHQWCCHRGLQPQDAEDVTQNVLIRIARNMQSFVYDPGQSFRGWLRRITENAVIDLFRERKRNQVGDENTLALLENTEARVELAERLKEVFDIELLQEAKLRVKERIESKRWQAWELTAVEQLSGSEVADRLKMNVATVYSSRYQVQQMIAKVVAELDGDE